MINCLSIKVTGRTTHYYLSDNVKPYILGIESSCDDTSAAVLHDEFLLSNVIAGQEVHQAYGGVVPEFASRAHQQNIVPVVDQALQQAKIHKKQLSAIACTQGPGLLGSLLVGTSFAKALSLSLGIPLINVDHMDAHILAHFIRTENNPEKKVPEFPFLCLTVSGGHTQIAVVNGPFQADVIGRTIDDAAGETFDKAAKILGLPYPGGVMIDKLAVGGNPRAFAFSEPRIAGFDYSFSGLKTSILYFVRDRIKEDPDFIQQHLNDLCASVQHAIVAVLMKKLRAAVKHTGIKGVAIAGGVSANTALRAALTAAGQEQGWTVFIPELIYSTDNAAMIAMAGLFSYREGHFAQPGDTAYARKMK